MKIKVLGIKRSSGEFTNPQGQKIQYDNYLLHHLADNNAFMIGECYDTKKVPAKALNEFMKKVGYADPQLIIQKTINLDYDQNGRLVDISIIR